MAKRNFNRRAPVTAARSRFVPPGIAPTIPICLLLFGMVVAVFFPVVHNGFINLDDPLYVTDNAHVKGGLNWEGVRWAFTNLEGGFWHPLTWLSYMLDSELFGMSASGFHLTNLLLHATNAMLLFLALQRLTRTTWRSVSVALLFACHPLHVETVAWISDRKDLLGGFFWMLALLTYGVYVEKAETQSPKAGRYRTMTLISFACGLMSKGTLLTLPLILLLVDWWPSGRIKRRDGLPFAAHAQKLVSEKWAFVALAAGAVLVSVYGQGRLGALPSAANFPIGDRVMNATLAYAHYLVQTVWPTDLAIYYPIPRTFAAGQVLGAAVLIAGISVAALKGGMRRPYLTVGWYWYIIALLPTSGLVQVGSHARADRYTYLPLIGVFWLMTWALSDLLKRSRLPRLTSAVAAPVAILACVLFSRQQIACWKDSETVFRRALAVTSDNELAHNNLGTALAREGRLDEAISHLQEAIRLVPQYADAHNNLGAALGRHGRLDEAIVHLSEAARLLPNDADTLCNYADALSLSGRPDEAIRYYEQVLRIRPGDAIAQQNLANALEWKRTSAGRQPQQSTPFRHDNVPQ